MLQDDASSRISAALHRPRAVRPRVKSPDELAQQGGYRASRGTGRRGERCAAANFSPAPAGRCRRCCSSAAVVEGVRRQWHRLTAGWRADPGATERAHPAPGRRPPVPRLRQPIALRQRAVLDRPLRRAAVRVSSARVLGSDRLRRRPRTPEGNRFWAEVTEDWLAVNSTPSRPGWHPYPTSERVIAWAVAVSAIEEWPRSLRERVASELWRQARYLTRTVEWDIGGNHLIRNATAIALAGVLYPDSDLLPRGLRLLEAELERQILTDGGHEERSTSYHRRIAAELSDLSSVLEADGPGTPAWLHRTIAAMEAWQGAIAGPDGSLPMLNDAWEGPPLNEASPPAIPSATSPTAATSCSDRAATRRCSTSGRSAPGICHAHAHADVLSFVLWADGRPVLIDPGTSNTPARGEITSAPPPPTAPSRSTASTSASSGATSALRGAPRLRRAPEGVAGVTLVKPPTTAIAGSPIRSSTAGRSPGSQATESSSSIGSNAACRVRSGRRCGPPPGPGRMDR